MKALRGECVQPLEKIAPDCSDRLASANAVRRQRAAARRESRVDFGDVPFAVQRVLLCSRYPRTAAAIAASAGVSRASGYRALLRIETCSGMPLVRQAHYEQGRHVTLWGVDWARLRAMG